MAALVSCGAAGAVESPDPHDQLDRQRAVFLCEWSKTHAPSGNPESLDFCADPQTAGIYTIRTQSKDWWRYWSEKDDPATNSLRDSFERDWSALQSQLQAEADKKDEEDLSREVHRMSGLDLCQTYRDTGSKVAYSELKRRNALSAPEWSLVRKHEVHVGMSEVAMICAWGNALQVNRTVIGHVVRKQYVYGERTYVYVDNGRVTAFQD
jgi:hypothetical protein